MPPFPPFPPFSRFLFEIPLSYCVLRSPRAIASPTAPFHDVSLPFPRVPGKSRILIDHARIPAVTLCERALSGPLPPPLPSRPPSTRSISLLPRHFPIAIIRRGFSISSFISPCARARFAILSDPHPFLPASPVFYIPFSGRRRRKGCE